MSTSRNQIRRTGVDNSPPTGLLPGELSIEMGKPTRLWVGVPTANDPTKQKLIIDVDALAALTADEATKAPLVHTHVIADTTGLQTELDTLQSEIDAKADAIHSHDIADVIDLQLALDGKANVTHQHAIGDVAGLRYELDLIGSMVGSNTVFKHTHQLEEVLGLQTALDGKSNVGHTHDFSQITGTPAAPGPHTHTEADITGLGALARKNTVGNADIDNGSITQSKMAAGAIGATELADNSVNGQKIALGGDTTGDIMVYNGTDWTRLPAGVSGQVLQTFGPTTPPQWVNPPSTLNNVQIAGRVVNDRKGTTDMAVINGPYSAYRVVYSCGNGLMFNTKIAFTVQVSDGAVWGAPLQFEAITANNTAVGKSGEFWLLGCAMPNTIKSLIDSGEKVDSIATGLTSLLRFNKGGGTLTATVIGYK